MRVRRLAAAAAVLVLASCGANPSSNDRARTATSTPTTSALRASRIDADVAFAQSMIAHHRQAVDMADLALAPKTGASAAVTDLATRIKAAQDPEITQMTEWLTKRGKPVEMPVSSNHHKSSMSGMMGSSDIDVLGAMSGTDFDRAWLDMMITHHEGAIDMSEHVKAAGSDTELRALADAIITAQQGEIDEMTKLARA